MGHKNLLVTRTYRRQKPECSRSSREASAARLRSRADIGPQTPRGDLAELGRSWGLPPESHFPEYADATGIPPTAAERVGCMIIQGRVRWPHTSNLLIRAGGLPPRKGPTGPLGAKPTASRSFVRVRGSGSLQCDTRERERSP